MTNEELYNHLLVSKCDVWLSLIQSFREEIERGIVKKSNSINLFGLKVFERELPDGVAAVMMDDDAYRQMEVYDGNGKYLGLRTEIDPKKISILLKSGGDK